MSIRLATLNSWLKATQSLGHLASTHMVGLVRYEHTLPALRDAKVRKRVQDMAHTHHAAVEAELDLLVQALINTTAAENSVPPAPHSATIDDMWSNRVTWELQPASLSPLPPNDGASGQRPMFVQFIRPDNDTANNHSATAATHLTLPYSAAGLFLRSQLAALEQQCRFLSEQKVYTHWGEIGISVLQAFYSSLQPYHCGPKETITHSRVFDVESPELHCCLEWVLPTVGWRALFVHHVGSPGSNGDRKWTNRHRLPNVVTLQTWREYFQGVLQ